ncbi:hypothetical protein LEP1GSC103_2394 [Leptospira borgpetersenii serovar Javanica str. UI 09931]|uniref:Uncharacterized protein n=6 Tax=Leptospira borgpetersenii TaxID=174 RepID=M3H0K2_LEPBO|nr:hypothetical protein LBBP_03911 [Leptospira borgpetersenii serovar Ballum]AXX16976.1 hypothetical protein C4Q31_16925 [Leptospira borgpetersenii serovar Ceylonica]EKP13013.1 hypothetical protein LEP1GSC128_3754 [Leptospira borgpetersenii str. 200801926]EKQ93704.1 hypothetical protein LEP1GSC101_1903 [Leptospira borgpetersenii str. UI 09149]EKR00891.1 hypothetical protein LEP1GSC121_0164 [Leptospira borgpetersenii serovar Castellonis str. 200801910]EMG00609.1 hypothetical protein LEP1GSC123_
MKKSLLRTAGFFIFGIFLKKYESTVFYKLDFSNGNNSVLHLLKFQNTLKQIVSSKIFNSI